MNVLSLFDGCRTGLLALLRSNIKVDKYYSSEINQWAIKVADKNFPEMAKYKLGDITNWCNWDIDWGSIDLILAGSPCQGFSIAGKQLNFKDERSKLYFVFEEILYHIKTLNPNVKFLLENVRMKKEYKDIITSRLDTEPVLIDSSLVSAQDRKRLYWTNITDHIELPKDKNIILKDILQKDEDVPENFYLKRDINLLILTNGKRKIGYFNSDSQGQRVYGIDGKSVTISALGGGWGAKTGLYLMDNGRIRTLTPIETERLQTLPDNYTLVENIKNNERIKICGNGWTTDIISYILSYLND